MKKLLIILALVSILQAQENSHLKKPTIVCIVGMSLISSAFLVPGKQVTMFLGQSGSITFGTGLVYGVIKAIKYKKG